MPTIASNKQPTIAIITAQYCEKLAVDAMLENKETFVRYTTVGKYLNFYHKKYNKIVKKKNKKNIQIFCLNTHNIYINFCILFA